MSATDRLNQNVFFICDLLSCYLFFQKRNSFGRPCGQKVISTTDGSMATTDEEIKEAFNVFDADNSGFIQVADVGLVIRALGKKLFVHHRWILSSFRKSTS